MSEANRRTIHTYDGGVQAYIDGTPHRVTGNQKQWIDLAFSDVSTTAKVLEIGSAFGRDARYLMELGYEPKVTDGTPAFVDYLRAQGFDAALLNIVDQQPQKLYDVIFASAVFLHFTDEDFDSAVGHVRNALDENGKFVFSLKQGHGETWSTAKMGNERYFRYWDRASTVERMGGLGFALIETQTFEDRDWLYLTTHRE